MTTGFGAFGKMPALGDFFRLNLPQGFIEPWDVWLQSALLAARSALGTRWNECFLTAPMWRFTLASGLAGPQAMTGVMMASVDRVGRQFPLTLAAPLPAGSSPERVHLAATRLFDRLETIALDMLEDGMTRDTLAHRLTELDLPTVALVSAKPAVRAGSAWMMFARDEETLLAELAGDVVARSYNRPSLWSAVSDTGGQHLLVCEGLPDATIAPALFELEAPVWQGRGQHA